MTLVPAVVSMKHPNPHLMYMHLSALPHTLATKDHSEPAIPITLGWVQSLDWTTGLEYWTGLLDWTTGLTQTAKYNSFSAEPKLNFLISSITSLALLPKAFFMGFLEVKGNIHI